MIHLKIEHDDIEILIALEKRFWRLAEAMGCRVEREKNETTAINRETIKRDTEQSKEQS
jgi:hypothetical protein